MTSREFCYWLQGYFELLPDAPALTDEQTATVKRHLAMVFHHEIDPSYPDSETLTKIHQKITALENKKPVHVPEPVLRC